jgi:hypothetical protein
MDRNQFFAELDQLTPSQIEARLPSWDDQQLKLVEDYLERRTIKPALLQKRGTQSVTHTELAAVATKAMKIATVSLIIAIGAMIAAVAAGLVAYQAFQFLRG